MNTKEGRSYQAYPVLEDYKLASGIAFFNG